MRQFARENAGPITGYILVTGILVLANVVATRTALKFLLSPPFAALAYPVFVNPAGDPISARSVIVFPNVTAIWTWLLAGTLGYNAISVALAVIGTMLLMPFLHAQMIVPPLALAMLTIL